MARAGRALTSGAPASRGLGPSSASQAVSRPAPRGRAPRFVRCGVASGARDVLHKVDVDLGDRSYPIYIGENLMERPDLVLDHVQGNSILVVTNETIAPLYLDAFCGSLERAAEGRVQVLSVVLPDGEEHKSLEVLMAVHDKAMESRLNRKSTFVALGGGVIGDMTGFAAATFQRGCNFIQVPTTVMAMVDSSVGGKTGVNHPLGKNMIGAFYQPSCVVTDTASLRTLPDRETRSGLSEIVKYGLIWDPELFAWLESSVDMLVAGDADAIAYAVEQSCLIKARVVEQDELEGGVRAWLNLGHTFGHAIETCAGYGTFLHGEAVSIGILMASDLSARMGWITKEDCERTRALLTRCKLPLSPPEHMTPEAFMDAMQVDKKNVDGNLRLVLPKGELGNCVVTADFDKQALAETLQSFCSNA